MLHCARSPGSGEEQKAGCITLRPRFCHPGTSQYHHRLLHASPSPTDGFVLGHSQPRTPRLSHHPGPQEAGSPAKRSFHCLSPAALDHARQSSAPFPLSHWFFLPNRAGTRLAVSCMPRLSSRPGQGRGFCVDPTLQGRGQARKRSGAASAGLVSARLGSVCSSGGGGRLG